MRYILGIDIGTTAIKGAVIGEDGKIYGTKTSEYPLTTLPTGEVEADLQLYINAFTQSIKGAVEDAKVDVADIKLDFLLPQKLVYFLINITSLCVKLSHGWIQERRKKPSI